MPVNVPYTITSWSGEDPGYPCRELLLHSQDCRGWCTPRGCAYPQHLTLRLERPAALHQIQLLSHEFKIAAKVEIQVAATAPADLSAAAFTRLGYLSFDSNERTQHSARELKSVTLGGTEAALVRLVIHRCHANALNAHHQVGLITLNVVGDPLPPHPAAGAGATPSIAVPPSVFHAPPAAVHAADSPPAARRPPPTQPQRQEQRRSQQHAEAPPEAAVDSVTAQRIEELQAHKAAAVAVEDYDEAKRLKGTIDKLKAAGGRIAALEARKAAAVAAEDYDTAKVLKAEVERLRQRAYTAILRGSAADGALGSPTGSAGAGGGGGGSRPASSAAGEAAAHTATAPFAAGAGAAGPTPPLGAADAGSLVDSGDAYAAHAAPGSSPDGGSATASSGQRGVAPPGGQGWPSYDERPARAKGAYDLAGADASTPPPGAAPPRRASALRAGSGAGPGTAAAAAAAAMPAPSGGMGGGVGPPPPEGFPADLPPPEPLPAADAKDAVPLVEVVGEYLSRCLYSRAWQLREAALSAIAADVGRPTALPALDGSGDGLRTLCRAVARGLRDRVAAVSSAALVLLRELAAAAPARRFPPRDVHAALGDVVPLLVERTADISTRSREQAVEVLVHLARVKDTGLRAAPGQLLRPLKRGESPKAALGRLQAVAALLPVVGVALRPGGEGFSAEALMQFVGPALTNSAAEVRGAGVDLVVRVAAVAGPGAVLPLLPADLNPKVREQIAAGLASPAGGAAAGGAAREHLGRRSSVPPPHQGMANGTDPAAAARRRGSQETAAAPAMAPPSLSRPASGAPVPPPKPRGSSQHQADARSSERDEPAAAAKRPQRKQLQRRSPSPPAHRPIPAHYPAAALSASPPPAAATPLAELSIADEDPRPYEVELRQREAQLGPSHPAVAEAASNLAIIYNQRGQPAAALPLYQRALEVWEATRGPASADVAHALTDIAVIHLEAGREREGRELLTRALAIQEALLGPAHPDVVAIRDVLEE